MFEAVVARWMSGELTSPQVEPWRDFRARVSAAIAAVTGGSGSRRVAVFTSGGPIGATVQEALNAPAESGIELNWRVRNSSVTELLFSKRRMTLDSFNQLTHLEDHALHSFR
jgi:broad specificity phosphatase PhoE